MNDIFGAKKPHDEEFLSIRDSPDYEEIRDYINLLWSQFHTLADSHFINEIGKQFHRRYWEMYLACALKNTGMDLSSEDSGPDLCVKNNESSIWVEAIAPTNGEGPDAVPPPARNGIAEEVPEEQVIFRLRNAIETKFGKYLKYLEEGTISHSAPYIIAVNGNKISHAQITSRPSIIEKSVYPLGANIAVYSLKEKKLTNWEIEHRPEIIKKSKSTVTTTVFEDKKYEGISAIIYSNTSVWNRKRDDSLGEDFLLLHNPLALNPISNDWLKVGDEIKQNI
ncbi:hypothetical protein [Gimesia aquarii]|uniref:Uncharacterized protein n=1 Tax=Gimesia aquarii TaxID=2527964 RepID=A0A517WUY2_9PLAN|nr:hypothetical protein [Gimesia aquarii]QDU09061.1 hypothetical protein V202x_24320 [Gimesia aquarii]